MKDKQRKEVRYKMKIGIYNSLIVGADAYDECMPCAWYDNKCKGDGTERRCRYRPIKFRKATMKKIEKKRREYGELKKEYEAWKKDVGLESRCRNE